MANEQQAREQIHRLMQARVPLVVVRTSESTRGLRMLYDVAENFTSMSFHIHSRAKGLYQLGSQVPVSDDRSLAGALDFATSAFMGRPNANFILTEVEELENESSTARHLAEMVRLAEHNHGALIVLADSPVWSGLARLGMTVTLDLPDAGEMYQVVSEIINAHREAVRIEWGHDEVRRAAEILVGVTEAEAVNAVSMLLAKPSRVLMPGDEAELSEIKDSIYGDVNGIEHVRLYESDYEVGGLETLKEWLARRRRLFQADLTGTALRAPRGVLLVGVPGCGKSLSAKAIAAEWQLPLYRLDMASVLGMYVGLSENRFRDALEAADRVAPCVLWVDEIEKALANGSGDSGTTTRLIGQFLFWLQESRSKVFLVATANDVTSLPPELLRKGRFDEMFFIDLPEAEERRQIIELYFRKYVRIDPAPSLVHELVGLSEGFSGADIDAVIHEIGAETHLQHGNLPPDHMIRETFAQLVPMSRSNPEEIEAIRAWGRERAKPAGREVGPRIAAPSHGRRVMVGDSH